MSRHAFLEIKPNPEVTDSLDRLIGEPNMFIEDYYSHLIFSELSPGGTTEKG